MPECNPSTWRIEDLGRGDLIQVDCASCHRVALLTPDFRLRFGLSPLGCRTMYRARYRSK
jgi:hypothetical protein